MKRMKVGTPLEEFKAVYVQHDEWWIVCRKCVGDRRKWRYSLNGICIQAYCGGVHSETNTTGLYEFECGTPFRCEADAQKVADRLNGKVAR